MSIEEFDAAFPDEAACSAYLLAHRWPAGVVCPRCDGKHVRRHDDGPRWRWLCLDCADGKIHEFSLRTGTIFENTHLQLRTWLSAVHLLTISRRALAPAEVQRILGMGSFQTAWHVCRRIREALGDPAFRAMVGLPNEREIYRGRLTGQTRAATMEWRRRADDGGGEPEPESGSEG